MPSRLIQLQDGIFVEVEVPEGQSRQLSGGLSSKVSASIDKIESIILSVARPIRAVWDELNRDMYIEQAEVELGLSFEGEGNIYITKSKATANLTVKFVLKSSPSLNSKSSN